MFFDHLSQVLYIPDMLSTKQLETAYTAFDTYNSSDPNKEESEGIFYPKELLYAIRLTDKLKEYAPDSDEYVQLAVRCQHIGRWEIPRSSYPMDRKGYLQWRTTLALHHAKIAEKILTESGYTDDTIEKVKFLLQKKQLRQNSDTQLLEDVICLVFIQYYLEPFAALHEDEKLIEILRKTLKKISSRAIEETVKIPVSDKVKVLIQKAVMS